MHLKNRYPKKLEWSSLNMKPCLLFIITFSHHCFIFKCKDPCYRLPLQNGHKLTHHAYPRLVCQQKNTFQILHKLVYGGNSRNFLFFPLLIKSWRFKNYVTCFCYITSTAQDISELVYWIIKLLHVYCNKQEFRVKRYCYTTTIKYAFYHEFPENY